MDSFIRPTPIMSQAVRLDHVWHASHAHSSDLPGRAAYAVALLHDGLGFGLDDGSLLFTDTVQDRGGNHVLLDWTLGDCRDGGCQQQPHGRPGNALPRS